MAEAIRTLSIKLNFKDAVGTQSVIDKIKSSFKGLEQVIQGNTKPAIQKLRNEINTFASTGNQSISTIESQVTALKALRREADINSKEFKELTADISKYEKQLDKARGRRPGQGGRALAATQIAGAVVSGGIFGGPEGAVGALGGAALGGVSGAFAGAAIGAQVGGIRQTLGEFADYAAQIARLEIALEGIAGSQDEFNQALAAARDVTKGLNVPQEVAIQGITRLTAAVKGAGGGVADAELAFRNINSAIIATGGGSEEVQGAVTALVQIFSKGKVSAEEINQIAERLPGTFNKIAKASGRTGPELTKALQKGQVGLNDLTKFLVSLGDEYGDLASTIANSSENAGARLQIAFNDLRVDVGNALQPVGAEFQDVFREFIETITPALVEVLPRIATFLLDVAKNLDVLAASALAAGAAIGVIAANAAILKAGGIVALFKSIATAATAAGVAAKGMSAAVLINPYVALAAGVTAATLGIVKYYKHQEELNSLLDEGKASTSTLKDKIQEYRDSITKATSKLKGINGEQKATGRDASRLKKEINELRGELERLEGTYKIRLSYEDRGFKFDDKGQLEEFTVAGNVFNAKTREFLRKQTPDLTEFDEPKPDADSPSSEAVKMTEIELNLRRQIREATLNENQLKLINLRYQLDMVAASHELKDVNKRTNLEEEAASTRDLALKKFTEEQMKMIVESMKEEAELNAKKDAALAEIHLITGDITKEQYEQLKITEEAKKLTELFPELFKEVEEALQQAATPLSQFKKGLREIFEEAMNLKDALANQAVQAVQTLGDTFADFVATGKADFADMTKSILQDLSRIFAKAALFKGLSLIPGVGNFLGLGGGASSVSATTGPDLAGIAAYMNAKGNVYAKNKIVPFAYGGIVNKPTIFPMAKGAGIMGEAGPEAIMPLRRGSNGKLGVEASGGVGSVVVNVDASGSRVQGDQPNAKALGSAIGAAVQAELVRQKRPGGLLS